MDYRFPHIAKYKHCLEAPSRERPMISIASRHRESEAIRIETASIKFT